MEVPGKRITDSGHEKSPPSSQKDEIYCRPCLDANTLTLAHGYCRDCGEYLCTECYMFHSKVTVTRNHTLLKRADMPQGGPPPALADKLTDPCPVHADKIIEFLCKSHDTTACSVCVALDHRNCPHLQYIPDIAKGLSDSRENREMKQTLKGISDRLRKTDDEHIDSIECLKKASNAYTNDSSTYRNELMGMIDTVLAQGEEEKQVYVDMMREKLNNARKGNTDLLGCVESVTTEMDDKQQSARDNSLFFSVRRAGRLIVDCKDSVFTAEAGVPVEIPLFKKSEAYKLLSEVDAVIVKRVTERYVGKEVSIQSPLDSKNCNITALHCLSDGRLIVSDKANSSVKLFSIFGKMTSELGLPSHPSDMAVVNSDQVVVTIPNNKALQFIYITEELTGGRTVNTDVKCHTIVVSGDNLITGSRDTGLRVMRDMDGAEIRTMCSTKPGYASCVSINPDNDRLYVTDSNPSMVKCNTLAGDVVGNYTNGNLKHPKGIAVQPDGSVYVCGWNSNNVHHFSSDCSFKCVLLGNGEVQKPRAVAIDRRGHTLYVSQSGTNKLKLFKLMD